MLLFLVLLISSIGLIILGYVLYNQLNFDESILALGDVIGVVGLFIAVIMGVIGIICNTGIEGEVAAEKAKRESLVYQIENDLYTNDNDIGKKELYEQITEFNSNKALHDANHDDVWIGMFYPDIYSEISYIELGVKDKTIKGGVEGK